MNKPQLRIIEYNGQPIAAKSTNQNTDINSFFLPVNVILFLKRGSVNVNSDEYNFHVESGECFFIANYSNCKVQKKLDLISNDFEAITFFIDYAALSNKLIPANIYNSKKVPRLFKQNSKSTREAFDILENHFINKTAFTQIDLKDLTNLIQQIMESVSGTTNNSISNGEDEFLSFLYHHVNINITLEKLASNYGLSTSSFHRLFVKKIGVSPHKWIKEQRLEYARYWMLFYQKPISEIYLQLGFEDISHFSREFKKKFGYNPSNTINTTSIEVIR